MSGKLLTVRISLQQVIDESNKFPVLENESGSSGDCTLEQQSNPFSDGLYSILGDMVDMLQQQVPEGETDTDTDTETESIASGKKRRRSSSISKQGPGRKLGWKQVLAPQRRLQPHWAEVMHREHARSHFGSEQKQARLKVFNNSIWDQIDDILTDENRVIEKSRVPLAESERKRLRTSSEVAKSSSSEEGEGGYDLEVYDDRHFYSQMLKSFISASSSGGSSSRHSGDAGMTPGSMRPEDLAALKQFKKSKSKVDRKASKGRKIRYVPHEKLKNFMFPIPYAESAIDADHLFSSLFQ